ncbi:MAG: hypothetical protein LBN00_08270 [Oscillospiraceae bacterium]|jgi:hypothetical protein|nr:hypothetical protein [Oscillospiraceae bacterium]
MTAGYLGRVWRSQGAVGLRAAFRTIAKRSREDAVKALNDPENGFPVLYLLAPEAEQLGLENALPERAKYGIWLVATKAGDASRAQNYAIMLGAKSGVDPPQDTLKWIIETGADWDGPRAGRDDYDAAIDLAVAYFATQYADSDTLAKIAELIFRRHRKGLFIHDLVWGFFQSANASALAVIAKYIVSDNNADTELACKLLGLEMPKNSADKVKAYAKHAEWLNENRKYIYLTGEHFNAMSEPHHLSHDEEAKYLGREIHPRTRAPYTPLTSEELTALEVFRAARNGTHGGENV